MSKENDIIEEKNSEDNSNNLDIIEEKNNDILKEKEENKQINSNKNLFKGARKSCQPVLSFINRQDSYVLRPSIKRKKTTGDYTRSNHLLSKFDENNSETKNNNKENKEIKKSKDNNDKNNKDDNNNDNNEINSKYNRYRIISSNLNIYERSKKNLLRRNNIIKKKQAKQLEEIKNNFKGPIMNDISQKIMDKKLEYTPIELRASSLHNKHILESILNENRIRLEKMEEEDKECEIMRQYSNIKSFNEKDWEDFIISQELWRREKQYKSKAAQLVRDNIEHNCLYIPRINNKSKLIISNLRKKILYLDDIHTRLYKDFDDLQERKKIRMCNSMPSFKPIINNSFKKSIFIDKNKFNKSSNKINKRLELLIEKKLNKNANPQNTNKFKNKILTNNDSKFKSIYSNYKYNNSILKSNIFNKKSKYSYSYCENQKSNISNNYRNYILMNKTLNLKNIQSTKKNRNNIKSNKINKSNSYVNIYKNQIKNRYSNNRSNNSYGKLY